MVNMRLIRKIVAELRRIRSRDVIAEQWHASMARTPRVPVAAPSAPASAVRMRRRAGGRIVAHPGRS